MSKSDLRVLIIIAMIVVLVGLWFWFFIHFPMMVYAERIAFYIFNTIVTFVIGTQGIKIFKEYQ